MKKVVKKTHKRLLQAITAMFGLILALFTVGEAQDHTLSQDGYNEFSLFERANADGGDASGGDYGGDGAPGNGGV